MKFSVGVMLSSFGMFWGAEGAGASWPGGDAALLAIIPGVLLVSIGMVMWLRAAAARAAGVAGAGGVASAGAPTAPPSPSEAA